MAAPSIFRDVLELENSAPLNGRSDAPRYAVRRRGAVRGRECASALLKSARVFPDRSACRRKAAFSGTRIVDATL